MEVKWKWGDNVLKVRHSEVKVETQWGDSRDTVRWKSNLNVLQKCHLVFANSRHSISPLPTPALPCPAGVHHCFYQCWWWWWWQWRWCFSLLKWLSVLATGCLLIFPLAAGSTAADGHTDQNGGSADEDEDVEIQTCQTHFVCVCLGCACVCHCVSDFVFTYLQFLIQLQITPYSVSQKNTAGAQKS